jgi:O-antigen ligase
MTTVSPQTTICSLTGHSYKPLLHLIIGLVSSLLVVFLPSPYLLASLALVGLWVLYAVWEKSPKRVLYLFCLAVLVVPPFYPSAFGGEFPVYVSNFLFLSLVLLLVLRGETYRLLKWDSIGEAGLRFLMALAVSLPFAYWFSGPSPGLQSSLRFLLLLQPFFIYVWICHADFMREEAHLSAFVQVLLALGALGAIYGIIDFYAPIPIPHPFAEQFIYLHGAKIRRAQGIFYEASSFGNVCAFFLVLSLITRHSISGSVAIISRIWLYLIIGIFSTALFLSYSRGSWMNVLVTVTVFLMFQQKLRLRFATLVILLIGIFVFLVYLVSPEIALNFFQFRLGTLLNLMTDPNFATSGRWEAWMKLFGFFADHPWLLLFGVGYKTLPHTNLFGTTLIADNGFLSLAFETGILGLVAFLSLNIAIFRTLHRASQHGNSTIHLYSTFLFAFWCGEMVQMLTGDIFTYWRNLIIYFLFMGAVQRVSRSSPTFREAVERIPIATRT